MGSVKRVFKIVAKRASGKGTFKDKLSDQTKTFKKLQKEGRIVEKTLVRTETHGRLRGRSKRKVSSNQFEKHALGRKGEEIVKKLYGGKYIGGTHPPDLVDKTTAYEVKTMSAHAKDKKIHIAKNSLKKKLDYAKEHKLKKKTIAVIINDKIQVFEKAGFQAHLRPTQMRKVMELPRVKKVKKKK